MYKKLPNYKLFIISSQTIKLVEKRKSNRTCHFFTKLTYSTRIQIIKMKISTGIIVMLVVLAGLSLSYAQNIDSITSMMNPCTQLETFCKFLSQNAPQLSGYCDQMSSMCPFGSSSSGGGSSSSSSSTTTTSSSGGRGRMI